MRNCGIRTRKKFSGFTEFEIYSCSRCGICIDACQLADVRAEKTQAVYFIQELRRNILQSDTLFNCMQCGRCTEFCPVGIRTDTLRSIKRKEYALEDGFNYKYIEEKMVVDPVSGQVGYFAGCMTHLTPSVMRAMLALFEKAGEKYVFMDKDGSVCCGRPLSLSGNERQARALIRENKRIIHECGITTLVTSCPICYRIFNEEYNLGIEVLHHSQYLQRLVHDGRLTLRPMNLSMTYHDPCDLGRGSGIYQEPRDLLASCGELIGTASQKVEALCCGNSLADLVTPENQRQAMRNHALEVLLEHHPDVLVTACPQCKKSFAYGSKTPVIDLAEIVLHAVDPSAKVPVQ